MTHRVTRLVSDLVFRVRALLGRRRMEADLADEVAFHLEREEQKYRDAGMSPEEAHRLARVRFGGEERFKESARESWGVSAATDLIADARSAVRQLVGRPAFSVLAVGTLALGIGGTVAIFSVVDGLMLRPLPVAEEERLVTFWMDYDWRGAEFDFVKERVQAFDGVAAYSSDGYTLRTDAGSSLVAATLGSAELFDVLGVAPVLGRTFEPGEDRPGAEPIVVVSHGFWQRELGADPGAIGRSLDLGGRSTTLVGVMPPGFYFPTPQFDVWTTLDLDPGESAYDTRGWLVLVARLRAGAGEAMITDDLERLTAAMGERWDYPDAWDKTRDPFVTPVREYLLGDVRPALLLLLGAVGLVLLMSCANVAALVVTRTADRGGEMAVRTALGAGRGRLARQIATETLLLGLVSGAFGMALAAAAFDVLVAGLPLTSDFAETLTLHWSALAAALALSVLASFVVSLAPLHGLLGGEISEGVLGARTGSGTAHASNRFQRALVVGEVLTAVVLATGAALLVRTVAELRAIDSGVEPRGVMTVDLMLPADGATEAERARFQEAIVERVEALPGVTAAGLINRVPVRDGGWQGTMTLPDRPDLTGDRRPNAYVRFVTPRTFEALGIEVVEGRGVEASDVESAEPVAVVNESFTRTIFPGESAVGRFIESHGFGSDPIRIVGVVRNVAIDNLVGEVPMAAYYPWAQELAGTTYAVLVAKTELDPTGLVAPIRDVVRELDPRAATGRFDTMEAVIDTAMAEPLRLRLFLGLFTLLGIVLGTVGVYGVVAYAAQRRRAEFGIRLALGAAPRSLAGEIVRDGMMPVLAGVAAGSLVAFLSSTVLAGFLFEVEPGDPVSLASAALVLVVAGAVAAFIPAWRASTTDPATALRSAG